MTVSPGGITPFSIDTSERDQRIGRALVDWLKEAATEYPPVLINDSLLRGFGAYATTVVKKISYEIEVERIRNLSAVPRA